MPTKRPPRKPRHRVLKKLKDNNPIYLRPRWAKYQWYYHPQQPDVFHACSDFIGGVPNNPRDTENKRGYATYYVKDKLLIVSEQGRCYDTHGVVEFDVPTIRQAEKLLEMIIIVRT